MYYAELIIKRPDQAELETASINEAVEFRNSAYHAIDMASDEYSYYSISMCTTYEEVDEWLSHNVALRHLENAIRRDCDTNNWENLYGHRSLFPKASGAKDEYVIRLMNEYNLEEFTFDIDNGITFWLEN